MDETEESTYLRDLGGLERAYHVDLADLGVLRDPGRGYRQGVTRRLEAAPDAPPQPLLADVTPEMTALAEPHELRALALPFLWEYLRACPRAFWEPDAEKRLAKLTAGFLGVRRVSIEEAPALARGHVESVKRSLRRRLERRQSGGGGQHACA
jgi:hypothetical protein